MTDVCHARALSDEVALQASRRAVTRLREALAGIEFPGQTAHAVGVQIAADLARWAGGCDPAPRQAAVDAWTPLGRPHERGWALLHLAETLVEAGQRDEATRALREAAAVAEHLGARPLNERVASVARRALLPDQDADGPLRKGSPPAPKGSAPPCKDSAGAATSRRRGLTARELEVLVLLAEGQSNSVIAQQLFISPKTAGVHVTHILAKLGAANRTQAATTAYRLGLGHLPT